MLSAAAYSQLMFDIIATNSDGEKQDNLTIGVHPAATDYIDKQAPMLEEEHPGGGMGSKYLHCFFEYTTIYEGDTTESTVYAYRDIRKEDTIKSFRKEYFMHAQFGAEDMTLKWGELDYDNLDSAYMVDNLKISEDSPDLFYVDMLQETEYTLTNSAWKKIKFVLVFKDPVSVEDDNKAEIAIYPNPASDFIKINMDNMQSYKIFDATGKLVISGHNTDSLIDVQALEKGFYNIVLIDYNAKMQSKKFIKL